jgi:hypothetical protein
VLVKNGERQTVEARQTLLSSNPQITVVRLENAPDLVMRQAVLRVPVSGDLIRGLFFWIESERARDRREQKNQGSKPTQRVLQLERETDRNASAGGRDPIFTHRRS